MNTPLRARLVLAACLALSLASASASARTITFEDLARMNAAAFTSNGFKFDATGDGKPYANIWNVPKYGQMCSPACPDSGSNEFVAPVGPTVLTMQLPSGADFSLKSFRGAGGFNYNVDGPDVAEWNGAKEIDVFGLLDSGKVVEQSFAIDDSPLTGPLPFTLDTLGAAFGSVRAVSFVGNGAIELNSDGFSLDDIVVGSAVSPVPEPASSALLLAGLGLGLVARRRARA